MKSLFYQNALILVLNYRPGKKNIIRILNGNIHV